MDFLQTELLSNYQTCYKDTGSVTLLQKKQAIMSLKVLLQNNVRHLDFLIVCIAKIYEEISEESHFKYE